MRPEQRRVDGVCARVGCTKMVPRVPPKTMPKHLRPMFLQALAAEPFCSSACCREHHRTEASSPVGSGVARKGYQSDRIRPHRAVGLSSAEESRRRRARIRAEGLPDGHKLSAAAYRNGCRCVGCTEAFRLWQRDKRRQQAAGLPAAV